MSKMSLASGLLDDLPRGRDAETVGTPPHSYFEAPENLAATESLRFEPKQNLAAKLFLGVVGGEAAAKRLSDGRISRSITGGIPTGLSDDRHHTVIAGSRAGKGRSFLVPNLLALPSHVSLLVLDPKGELANITASYRAEVLKQQVRILDPFGICGGKVAKYRAAYNPIEMLMKSDPRLFVPNAKLIADSLIVSTEYQETRHWDDTAKQILAALCIHVATHPRYAEVRDLVTAWRLAAELASPDPNAPGEYWLEKELLSNEAAGGVVKAAARQFYGRSGAEFTSVASNLRRQIDFLGIPCMADCLTGKSIDLRDLKRKPMTLYVAVPAMRMSELSGWLRLIVQLALAAMEEHFNETGAVGKKVFLLLDEFHVLKRLECLEMAAAQFANLATMVVVLQDLGQIQKSYSKSWSTFLGNSGCIQAFGLNDLTTQEYLSKCLGQAPTLTRSTSLPGFDQATQHAATGESWQLGVHPLMTPEELGRFLARDDARMRQLILRPGYRPALISRVHFDQHEIFKGRFDA